MEDSTGQTLVNADPKLNSMVKLHCSFGGKIKHRRGRPDQLCYAGGEYRIVTVERDIKFSDLFQKLSSVFNATEAFVVRYKHPCYDLDTLFLVEEDDDVENMVKEYETLTDDQRIRVRMFLFPPRIQSENLPDSPDSGSGTEFLFGFDEELGSDFGLSLDPVVEKEDRSVVQPKCGGSHQPLPGLSASSFASDNSVNDTNNGTIGKNVELEIPREGSVAGKAVSGHTNSGSSAGSNSDDNGKNVELQEVQCEGQVTGGAACVSVPVSGGKAGSGSGSADDGKNVELKEVQCEGHVAGGACVSVPVSGGKAGSGSGSSDYGKNVEVQSECEGQVSGGGCVYGLPVTTMAGGQTLYAVPAAMVNWSQQVYSLVPATVAVVRVNNQVDEENQEGNNDQKNA